jgi:hypothetical membrane protein
MIELSFFKAFIMNRRTQQGLAICGIIGPIFFTIVLIILGFLHPEYNHITQYISELGAVDAPYALIMNTLGFTLLGILIIAFAFALEYGVKNENGLKIGPILVAISGISFGLCGIFICDSGCIPISTIGFIHGYTCFIALYALILAPFFMFYRLASDDRWKNYHIYSLTIAVIALFMTILSKLHVFDNSIGLLQRLSYIIPFFWLEIMSIKLLQLLKTQECSMTKY